MERLQIINFVSNTMSCIIIYSIFFFPKIYLILNGNGNNKIKYFIFVHTEKSFIHNSYICSCPVKKSKTFNKEELSSINEYIEFYENNFSPKIIFKNIISILTGLIRNKPYLIIYH